VRCAVACAALLAGVAVDASPAVAVLTFPTMPQMPALPTVTLNGQSQTVTARMNNFSVSAGALDVTGWNVTVNGDAGAGHSAVFKIDCPGPSACGSDPVGYVSGGATLPANSLTLNSTGATWSGIPTPAYLCNTGCNVDSATAVKIANVGTLSAAGTWTTANWSATSLALTVPTTIRTPKQAGEVYKVDLLWTLTGGP
jgi:hypothetical protein